MPDIPTFLGVSGMDLWSAVHKVRDVPSTFNALLLNACRIADRLDALSESLEDEPLTVMSAKGERIANPLMTEHRMQLLALRQVLASMGFGKLEVAATGEKTIAEQLASMREG